MWGRLRLDRGGVAAATRARHSGRRGTLYLSSLNGLPQSVVRVCVAAVATAVCTACGGWSDSVSRYGWDLLTQADNGRTVVVNSGQNVRVELKVVAGFQEWTIPTTSEANLLPPVDNYPDSVGKGTTVASFQAGDRQGAALLRSSAAAQCRTGPPCGPATPFAWTVTIRIDNYSGVPRISPSTRAGSASPS